jgi:MFS family permease
MTLFGSVVGQLLFGYLADFYGRTRLYGIELILVIVSTIGVATSSYGFDDMSFLGLFTWWRFVMGIGELLLLLPCYLCFCFPLCITAPLFFFSFFFLSLFSCLVFFWAAMCYANFTNSNHLAERDWG